MIIEVECCIEDSAPHEPRAFFLGGRRIAVEQIVDRWPSEECSYFKLQADDGSIYILRHQENPEQWELVVYQSPESPGSPPDAPPAPHGRQSLS